MPSSRCRVELGSESSRDLTVSETFSRPTPLASDSARRACALPVGRGERRGELRIAFEFKREQRRHHGGLAGSGPPDMIENEFDMAV